MLKKTQEVVKLTKQMVKQIQALAKQTKELGLAQQTKVLGRHKIKRKIRALIVKMFGWEIIKK